PGNTAFRGSSGTSGRHFPGDRALDQYGCSSIQLRTHGGTMEQTDVRLRAAKDDLADAVGWVARNLPTRPTQPILRGMIFVADDDGLEIAGYDYEVSTQV